MPNKISPQVCGLTHFPKQMRGILAFALLAIGLLQIQGCAGSGGTGKSGISSVSNSHLSAITINVKWPVRTASRSAHTDLIPQATAGIRVTVATQSAPSTPLATTTLTVGQTSTTLNNLPAGALAVTATALDANRNSIASGNQNATTQPGQTDTVSIDMTSTVTSITLSPGNQTIAAGSTTTLTATGTNSDGDMVLLTPGILTWSSSNTGVATVSGGVVSGIATGSTNISVTDPESNCTASVEISVFAFSIVGTWNATDAAGYYTSNDVFNSDGTFEETDAAGDRYGGTYTYSDGTWTGEDEFGKFIYSVNVVDDNVMGWSGTDGSYTLTRVTGDAIRNLRQSKFHMSTRFHNPTS